MPAPALDTGKDLYSINTVRHSRMTRLTPSSYLYGYVRFKWGLLQLVEMRAVQAYLAALADGETTCAGDMRYANVAFQISVENNHSYI